MHPIDRLALIRAEITEQRRAQATVFRLQNDAPCPAATVDAGPACIRVGGRG
ncbi:MAG: hypothetical protein WA864_17985 [Acetobacteraceae bacterium]|jgi:hypothetical protein